MRALLVLLLHPMHHGRSSWHYCSDRMTSLNGTASATNMTVPQVCKILNVFLTCPGRQCEGWCRARAESENLNLHLTKTPNIFRPRNLIHGTGESNKDAWNYVPCKDDWYFCEGITIVRRTIEIYTPKVTL